MNKSLFSIALLLTVGAANANALPSRHGGERHSFTVDKTRTTERGTVQTHTEQTKTANGFTRDSVRTNPSGKTATRDISVSNDAATKTRTRDVSGTTYSGKSYSGEAVTQKTADGYTRDSSRTGPNGKTGTREVDASFDKENHTVTKEITSTAPNGQSRTETITKQYGKNTGDGE
jgi:hypothetical protein